jgi:tRNA modification GTPase
MPLTEPIVAIATPPGRGAVGIIRLSGSDLQQVANQVIGSLPPPRVATLRGIRSNNETIDHALVIYFQAPRSFTGEQVIEIQAHGGITLMQEVLKICVAAGARIARPGEFTERAFLNGKLDLIQAEAIADLIESTSMRAARLALNSLSGKFSREVNEISAELKNIRIQTEATIDFPEDDLPSNVIVELTSKLAAAAKTIERMLANADRGARLNSGVDIAIVGAPNVGKSTLLNVLAGDDKAIVTDVPGTTRDILSVDINLDGLAVRIHDTAGLRETSNVIEQEGVRRAKEKISQVDAILYIVDGEDDSLAPLVRRASVETFTIRNKIDLDGLLPRLEQKTDGPYIQLSAKRNLGIDLLRSALLNHFGLGADSENIVLARQRHLDALSRALDALSFDYASLCYDAPELSAERLRLACNALAELTGEYTSEDLLGDIFSTFCIGK